CLPAFAALVALVVSGAGAVRVSAASIAPVPKSEKKFVPYRITRADRIAVSVLGEPELSAGGKRVEAMGTINLPLIQEIRLVGLTIAEAQEAIAKKYREERYLRNPVVSVTVEDY